MMETKRVEVHEAPSGCWYCGECDAPITAFAYTITEGRSYPLPDHGLPVEFKENDRVTGYLVEPCGHVEPPYWLADPRPPVDPVVVQA